MRARLKVIGHALATLLALAMTCGGAQAAEEIITLKTRPEVTLPYLLTQDQGVSPRWVAVLFAGGAGAINLRRRDDGALVRSENFVIRTRALFVKAGIATAAVDSPSDTQGMNDIFRQGEKHAADIALVVADLRMRFPQAKIALIGTSRGTVSAAYNALALGSTIDAVVLTSSVFNASRAGSGVSQLDFSKIKTPLLFVHHREDGCNVCPYNGAARWSERFPLISVSGGLPPQTGPCDPLSAHGYFGKEAETVNAISLWISGQPYATEIK
jgi:hypothetical protein